MPAVHSRRQRSTHQPYLPKPLVLAACLVLTACGDAGSQTPQALQGAWGADCQAPFIQFEGSRIHIYPDDTDYSVTRSDFDGKQLTLSYETAFGPATETYAVSKDSLVLTAGHYRDMDVTWHKAPLKRCKS